jgi:hypothetical protein
VIGRRLRQDAVPEIEDMTDLLERFTAARADKQRRAAIA